MGFDSSSRLEASLIILKRRSSFARSLSRHLPRAANRFSTVLTVAWGRLVARTMSFTFVTIWPKSVNEPYLSPIILRISLFSSVFFSLLRKLKAVGSLGCRSDRGLGLNYYRCSSWFAVCSSRRRCFLLIWS